MVLSMGADGNTCGILNRPRDRYDRYWRGQYHRSGADSFFAQSTTQAVTIALVFGTVVKLIAAPIYFARGHINFRVLAYLAAGGLPGVLLGSLLLASMDKASMNEPVLILVGFTIVFSAGATLMRGLANRVVSKPIAPKRLSLLVAPIGLEVGFSSAGAGALGSVVLMRFTSLLPAEVVGTDLAFGLLLSMFGGSIHVGMTGLPDSDSDPVADRRDTGRVVGHSACHIHAS